MEQFVNFIKENPVLCITIGVVIVLIILLIVVIAVTGKKDKELTKKEEKHLDDKATAIEKEEEKTTSSQTTIAEKPAQESTPVQETKVKEPTKETAPLQEKKVKEPAKENTPVQETKAVEPAKETTPIQAVAPIKETTPVQETKAVESAKETTPVQEKESSPSSSEKTKTEKPVRKDFSKVETKASGMAGKWIITKIIEEDPEGKKSDGTFFFELKASNGQKMITSEEYTSLKGAINGIETYKSNISKGNLRISLTKKKDYVCKLLNGNKNLLGMGEHYATKVRCQSSLESITRLASTAVLEDAVNEIVIKTNPIAEVAVTSTTETEEKNGYIGKWILKKINSEDQQDCAYYFELHASNGQLLLSSEEYSTLLSAKKGIETHKSNIAIGNIKAVLTKKGDYMFKVLAGNGQLLCLGEHYETLNLCQSAIESVKRFSKTATVTMDSSIEEDNK